MRHPLRIQALAITLVSFLVGVPAYAGDTSDSEQETTFKIFWSTSLSAGDIDPEDGPIMGFRFEAGSGGNRGLGGDGRDTSLIELQLWRSDGKRTGFAGLPGRVLRPLIQTRPTDAIGDTDAAYGWMDEPADVNDLALTPAMALCINPYGCGEGSAED